MTRKRSLLILESVKSADLMGYRVGSLQFFNYIKVFTSGWPEPVTKAEVVELLALTVSQIFEGK